MAVSEIMLNFASEIINKTTCNIMARYNIFYKDFQPQTIIVDGVKMTTKEFKAKFQAKNAKPKKAKRDTAITILPSEINEMMKGVRTLKSFVAYYENGYKQWGNIAKNIINLNTIQSQFIHVVNNTKQAVNIIGNINDIAKENDKDVFHFVRKLSWKLEDVKNDLDSLTSAISQSGVLERFGTHECINGTGRRLGLQTLMYRTYGTIKNLNAICISLQTISDNGLDVFSEHVSKEDNLNRYRL